MRDSSRLTLYNKSPDWAVFTSRPAKRGGRSQRRSPAPNMMSLPLRKRMPRPLLRCREDPGVFLCVSVCVLLCIVNSLRLWSRLSVWQDVDRVSVQLSFSLLQDPGRRRRHGRRCPPGQGSVLLSVPHNEGRGQFLSLLLDSVIKLQVRWKVV